MGAESTGTLTVAVSDWDRRQSKGRRTGLENARMANPLWACVIAAHWNGRLWSCLEGLGLGLIVIH